MLKAIKITAIIIIASLFAISCKDADEEFTIKGKLIKTCNNQEPVIGAEVFLAYNYGINSKYNEIKSTTGADGSFALTYKSDVTMGELVIRGRQANGNGTLNYLFGIPKNKNLDIGNLYQTDNFFALVKIEVKRATTSNDTIYYKRIKSFVFQQYIIGPFITNQVLDTISFRNTQFYDLQNKSSYYGDGSFPFVGYAYTIGKNGKEKLASNELFIPCNSNNIYQVIIE